MVPCCLKMFASWKWKIGCLDVTSVIPCVDPHLPSGLAFQYICLAFLEWYIHCTCKCLPTQSVSNLHNQKHIFRETCTESRNICNDIISTVLTNNWCFNKTTKNNNKKKHTVHSEENVMHVVPMLQKSICHLCYAGSTWIIAMYCRWHM